VVDGNKKLEKVSSRGNSEEPTDDQGGTEEVIMGRAIERGTGPHCGNRRTGTGGRDGKKWKYGGKTIAAGRAQKRKKGKDHGGEE
jgi:hypothetical protein